MTRSGMDLAFAATLHCLTGCAIGEVLGMALGAVLGWSNLATIVVSIVLAFAFGYGLTIRSLVKGGLPLTAAARIALASDSLSIAVMELVGIVALPVNAWRIRRGGGHALVHRNHGAHH